MKIEVDSRLTCAYIACLQANNYMLLLPDVDLIDELAQVLEKQLFYIESYIRNRQVSGQDINEFIVNAEDQNARLEKLIDAIEK